MVTAFIPEIALGHSHSAWPGIGLGLLLAGSGARSFELAWWVPVGFLLGHLVTQQLAFANLRVLLLLPFLLAFLRTRRPARGEPSTTT